MRIPSFLIGMFLLATALRPAAAGESGRSGPVDSSFWAWKPTSLQGPQVDMGKFHGKYLLLNFWGEWCPKCREETAFLRKLRSKYPRLQILGIYRSDKPERTRQWVEEHGMDWPQVPITDAVAGAF